MSMTTRIFTPSIITPLPGEVRYHRLGSHNMFPMHNTIRSVKVQGTGTVLDSTLHPCASSSVGTAFRIWISSRVPVRGEEDAEGGPEDECMAPTSISIESDTIWFEDVETTMALASGLHCCSVDQYPRPLYMVVLGLADHKPFFLEVITVAEARPLPLPRPLAYQLHMVQLIDEMCNFSEESTASRNLLLTAPGEIVHMRITIHGLPVTTLCVGFVWCPLDWVPEHECSRLQSNKSPRLDGRIIQLQSFHNYSAEAIDVRAVLEAEARLDPTYTNTRTYLVGSPDPFSDTPLARIPGPWPLRRSWMLGQTPEALEALLPRLTLTCEARPLDFDAVVVVDACIRPGHWADADINLANDFLEHLALTRV
jgi:hypothetical protein